MHWKKWISTMLAAVMFLSIGTAGYADPGTASNSMKVGSAEGYPGDIVNVPVYVTPEDLIAQYDISIGYNAASLELVPGDEVTGEPDVILDDEDFKVDFSNSGIIHVKANPTFIMNDTKIFTLHFKIKDSAQPGELNLTVPKHDLYEGPEIASTTAEEGKITVKSFDTRHTVTFYTKGGSQVESATDVISGTTISEPPAPTREGYTFGGWYKDTLGRDAWNFATDVVTSDMMLYAKWITAEQVQYNVTFDSQGGSAVISATHVTSGTTISEPPAPTKPGYTFGGWYKEAAGTHAWSFAEDAVTSDVTLYAKWTRHEVEIQIVSVSGTPGSTVEVPVIVHSSTYGIAAYNLQIDFDKEALEVTGVTGETGDYFDSNYDNDAGWVKTAWVDSNAGDTPITAGEKLFTVSFKIKSGAALGDKKMTVQTQDPLRFSVLDSFGTEMDKTLNRGKVAVKEGPLQHTVTFDSQGGSAVSSLTQVDSGVTISAPPAPTKAGYTFAGWYKEAAGTNAWNFTADKVTSDVTLYAKWTSNGSNNSDNSNNSNSAGTPSTPGTTNPEKPAGLQVIVDGVVKDQIAAGSTTRENGKSVLTAAIDPYKLAAQLKQAADQSKVVIPVTTNVDKVLVTLTGEAVKSMENKQAVLEVQTLNGTYKLPAGQIAIDDISAKLGEQVKLSDIVVHVEIAKSVEAAQILAENVAAQGGFEVAAPPVNFNVMASYNGKIVGVEQFSSYVEREIPLPAGVDLSKVTTAAVLDSDGSVRHVPTYVTIREGKNYAVINSLTNSDYFLIWNPKTFADVEGHWSKEAVNDMASRMIVKGIDDTHYNPNAVITRAELAAIVVRALGLSDNGTSIKFTDIQAGDWYAGAVAKAAEYGLIRGYENHTFAPNQTITRQEALVIMDRAMMLAGLQADGADTDSLLSPFADRTAVASWATQAMAAAVKNGLVKGAADDLMPTGNLTRAETAAIVQRFLIKANLIDNRQAN
ncbi:InlB B-repeat-containing protein [Paenibacillus sp. JX-17]|uniref:InlB B-repeat-containing protein n=1 Tax=Paenibacillus lacisoli TaxID=3064525 RepID=A0ABT9CE93_9BACL|nr:InlB B-repeat-containing protein [Paenibacillus sp. JX-17]MDO7907567.1 InlB B-repeat-containing protein [Paenibacillus sp. JX-17]